LEFIVSLLSNPSILLGCFAFIGLITQQKTGTEVLTGTFKTIIGFLIFSVGANTITDALQNFNVLFQEGFNIPGVIASPEAATALAQNAFGFVVSGTLILGFVMNLIFARITPFKNIFFHGGHNLFFACVIALLFKSYGYSDGFSIIVGGAILGFFAAALPTLCQPFMRNITGGDDMAIGHYNMVGYALSGYIGKLFAKHKEKTTESIKFPGWLSFFRDFLMGIAVIMLILFYVATFAAGESVTSELAGDVHWLVFPLIQALTFAAGMSILMSGVRMFLAEITEAFSSISEKFIPNSRPALDVPTIFPFAPTAVLVGFLTSYLAGLLAIVVMAVFNFPIIIIPAAHICFFSGGAAGVFGNSTGGWRGAITGSFVMGLLLAFLPILLYPIFAELGIEGSAFPNVDYNVVGILLERILAIFN